MEFGINVSSSEPILDASTLAVGEIGSITGYDVKEINGLIVLRTFSNIVCLTNPTYTWDLSDTLKVTRIQDATVTLKFGKG